jgi:hypothetical protein
VPCTLLGAFHAFNSQAEQANGRAAPCCASSAMLRLAILKLQKDEQAHTNTGGKAATHLIVFSHLLLFGPLTPSGETAPPLAMWCHYLPSVSYSSQGHIESVSTLSYVKQVSEPLESLYKNTFSNSTDTMPCCPVPQPPSQTSHGTIARASRHKHTWNIRDK